MIKKGFVNQKLGKRTTRRCGLAKIKVQFDRRTQKQRGLSQAPKRND